MKLMQQYPIDKVAKTRVDMSSLVDWINSDDEAIDEHLDITSTKYAKHYFANGAYVREMSVPADTVVVGRIHKHETINILLEGEIMVFDESGSRAHLKAPHVFVAPPGNQKAAITITPVRWLNSFACDTTDPQEAIELLTCETLEEYSQFLDSEDVKLITHDLGHTDESMAILVNTKDVDLSAQGGVYICESKINGTGLFADEGFEVGQFVAEMRAGELRTITGRFTNHSLNPNSKPRFIDGVLSLVCVRDIAQDEEITCNYREVLNCRHEQGDL